MHASLHPVRPFAPLAGYVEARVGPGTPVALIVAAVGVWQGFALAARLPWRWLLVTTYVVTVAWTLALAFVDGRSGLTREIVNHNEYLPTARRIHDVPAMLRGFVDRIPVGAPGSWETHVAGHPPGALLLFVGLVSVGLGGAFASALAITLVGCTTPVAVLVDAAEPRRRGRRAAGRPVPGAGAGRDLGGGVGRRGVRRSRRLGARGRGRGDRLDASRPSAGAGVVLGGLLLGCCLLLSYGLVLLAPAGPRGHARRAVLAAASRRWRSARSCRCWCSRPTASGSGRPTRC